MVSELEAQKNSESELFSGTFTEMHNTYEVCLSRYNIKVVKIMLCREW